MTIGDIKERFNHLKSLEDGWLDGEGKKLDIDKLDFIEDKRNIYLSNS